MSETLNELRKQQEETQELINKIGKEIEVRQNSNKSKEGSMELSDEQKEDTRPIFAIPDELDIKTPTFEAVHRTEGNEEQEGGGEESTPRRSIEELTEELNKARLEYFKKDKEQNAILKIAKK